jgi:hypothetical protein
MSEGGSTAGSSSMVSLLGLDPQAYKNHFTHGEARAWPETNCYVDLWIELLHGWGLDPVPMFSAAVALDWEGDGFTFVKPWLEDLFELYGLDTMEHNPWRSVPDTIDEQLRRGRSVVVECDSYFLPDTAGVAYQLEHVKSSVAVEAIDVPGRRMRYFHGRSYYEVTGDDFTGTLRIAPPAGAVNLPPYFEIVKADRLARRTPEELRKISLGHLRKHLARTPAGPRLPAVRTFAANFARDLAWLQTQPPAMFHLYSFASVRGLGSSAECLASYVRWLFAGDGAEPETLKAAAAFEAVSGGAKALQFRLARAARPGSKPWDPGPSLESLAASWDEALAVLRGRMG